MIKHSIRLVISDMDGTLIDSEGAIAQASAEALVDWGITCSPAEFKPFTGLGDNKFIAGVSEKYGVPYTYDMNLRAYEIYERHMNERVVAYPWSSDLLRMIKSQGCKIAIASAADRIRVVLNLKRLGFAEDFFDAVIAANDVSRQKPNPDVFLTAAERAGEDPRDSLVLEDATMGVKAAKAAGALCMAVTTSYDAAALREFGADYVTGDFSGLEALLK